MTSKQPPGEHSILWRLFSPVGKIAFLTVAFGCALLLSLGTVRLAVASPAEQRAAASLPREPITPIPRVITLDSRRVALGRALFHETKLSKDGTVSCASCHDLRRGGVDGLAKSLGINRSEGTINAPSVFNSGLNFRQFWDGRASTLEDQVDGPVQSPEEMGSTWEEVIAKLSAVPHYVAAFDAAFSDGIQPKNVRAAIAEFERSLTTPDSRFDKYLRGDDSALTPQEKEGYRQFKAHGCANCHQGVNIGGNMFETFGAIVDYFEKRGNLTKADLGRYNVTGDETDRYAFKVPSLRNVALTAPYFHDGSVSSLEEAVKIMGQHQLGKPLPDGDVIAIAKFLNTLTGEYGGKSL